MGSTLSIAIIEDHAALREELSVFLARLGHSVHAFATAAALRDSFVPADLFIVDIGLPGEDGISLARWIRTTLPATKLFILTANDDNYRRIESYQLGVDLFLTKPVEPVALAKAIEAVRMSGVPSRSGFQLDRRSGRLFGATGSVRLSSSECALLERMAAEEQMSLSTDQVAASLNLDPKAYSQSTVEARISILRKKLVSVGGGKNDLASIRGRGYRLNCQLRVRSG